MAENEIMTMDTTAIAEDLATVELPETKASIDWKAAGLGFGAACLVGGLIYGGYKGYKYYKAKKEAKEE